MGKLLEDIPDASHFGIIPRKLLEAGYQQEELKKTLYGNLYRVIKENWQDKGFRTKGLLDEL